MSVKTKNKKIIIIAVIAMVVFVLAVIGYLKAVPGAGDQTDSKPQIEITPAEYNFGKVEFGQIVRFTFKVKNIGQEPLKILKTATSCGCTTAKIAKQEIAPGEQVDLDVEYDTGAMGSSPHGKGAQERIIYVKTNDPIKPQAEVIINAYVK